MITNQIVVILIMVDYDLFSLAAVVVGNSYSDSLSMKVSQVSTSVGWLFSNHRILIRKTFIFWV
jgi:hypothetical protein